MIHSLSGQTELWHRGVCYYFCRPALHFAPTYLRSSCVHEFANSQLGSSHSPGMVHRPVWDCDGTAGTRLATHSRSENDSDLGPDWIRENSCGISHVHRPFSPKGHRRRAYRHNPSLVRLSLESFGERHPEKPGAASRRNPSVGRRPWLPDAGNPHSRAHRRHSDEGAALDVEAPAAHPGDDAGVFVHSTHSAEKPRDSQVGGNGHRG